MGEISIKKSNMCVCLPKVFPFTAVNLMLAQQLRANLFLSQEPRLLEWRDHSRTRLGNMAWEELTIHQIMAISAFPFHMGSQQGYILMRTPFSMWNRGWPGPSFILEPCSRRLMNIGPIPLYSRRAAPIQPQFLLWKYMYLRKAEPKPIQQTHQSSPALMHHCFFSLLWHTNGQRPVLPFNAMSSSKGGWQGI